jgi:hypothetical protein
MGKLIGWLAGLFKVADDSNVERTVFDKDGYLYQRGTKLTAAAAQINKLFSRFTVTALDGSTGKKACVTNGVSSIAGGTGIADMTLAAPADGDVATVRIASITSGSVVVTCAEGVTFDGTNNTATFDAAGDTLQLAYKSATQWQIVLNIGAVALSTV